MAACGHNLALEKRRRQWRLAAPRLLARQQRRGGIAAAAMPRQQRRGSSNAAAAAPRQQHAAVLHAHSVMFPLSRRPRTHDRYRQHFDSTGRSQAAAETPRQQCRGRGSHAAAAAAAWQAPESRQHGSDYDPILKFPLPLLTGSQWRRQPCRGSNATAAMPRPRQQRQRRGRGNTAAAAATPRPWQQCHGRGSTAAAAAAAWQPTLHHLQ